jgi:hypothetical protein
VLDAGLEIPVITTLASATALTKNRSEWFFRANNNDAHRLRELWLQVERERKRDVAGEGPVRVVALYEDSAYGEGLAADLVEVARPSRVQAVRLDPDLTIDSASALIADTLGESADVRRELFVLGTASEASATSVTVAFQAISRLREDGTQVDAIYTVGSSSDLLRLSPTGTITAGESGLGPIRVKTLANEITQYLRQAPPAYDFYPTTLQAARFIVPEAVARAVATVGDPSNLHALRSAIREQLEQATFPSLQPPGQVTFSNGEMNAIFQIPLYRIAPEYQQLANLRSEPAWIEYLDERLGIHFLEAPLKVRVLGHEAQGSPVSLTLYRQAKVNGELDWQRIEERGPLALAEGASETVTFHVRAPGNYEIRSNMQSYPAQLEVSVRFSPFYLVCVFAAVIAVILKHKLMQISWPMRCALLAEGVLAAVAVAFISTYIQYSLLPVAPLDWNVINGVLYGFIGGWFGPTIITQLSSRVLPARATSS